MELSGNIIYLGQSCISGVSEEFGAKLHHHPLLEIYVSWDGDSHLYTESDTRSGPVFVIAPGTVHAIADTGKRGIAVFLDPLSEKGYSLSQTVLEGQPLRTLEQEEWTGGLRSLRDEVSEDSVRTLTERIVSDLCSRQVERPFADTVMRVIELLNAEDCVFDMDDLAGHVFLSKSRIAHLFSEQTGITLKEYIQYKRLENACRRMVAGAKITDAAYDTGFAGSSHIASSSMKMTGMQLKKMLNL